MSTDQLECAESFRSGSKSALPPWRSVLAVVAHPDDESFGLGAVLGAYATSGAATAVLCFTHGEASTLHGRVGDLHDIRRRELAVAARLLGLRTATLLRYLDGHLAHVCRTELAGHIIDAAQATEADALVVFDPSGVTGHPDHAAATAAAMAAACILDLPVLGWTIPDDVASALNAECGTTFIGTPEAAIDYAVPVDRSTQRIASAAHASQAAPSSVLWRRLELLGDVEHLRLLRRTGQRNQARSASVE